MSRHCIITPKESLIDVVASRFEGAANDFSSSIVVFPGKRPAHFVRKALAQRVGASFIPPRIFSIDSFVEYLVSEKLGLSFKQLETFDAIALLFGIHTSIAGQLGGEHFNTIDRFIGLGMKLYTELEELVMVGVSVRQISESLEAVPLGRVQTLLPVDQLEHTTALLVGQPEMTEEVTAMLRARGLSAGHAWLNF